MKAAPSQGGSVGEPMSVWPCRARLELWLDRAVVGLLGAIVIAAPLLMGALGPREFVWVELLTIGAAWLAAIRLIVSPEPKIFTPAIFWMAAAFATYAVVRYRTADLEYVARKELLWVLTFLVIFFLALNHLHDPRRAVALFVLLLIVGMGMSLFALRQHITGSNQVWDVIRPSYAFRGSGTFIYPNHFAGFLELLLPFGIAALFLGPFSSKVKLVIAYCAIWLVIGLYVSLSRAGWIAALLGLLIVFPLILRNGKAQTWGFAIFVLLLLAGLGWELKTGTIRKRFETMTGTNPTTDISMRWSIWKAAWNVWYDAPVFGVGPGHFDFRFRPYRDPTVQMRPGRAHNDYLDLLADWGLAGALPIVIALAVFSRIAVKEWWAGFRNTTEPPNARNLVIIASTVGITSILAHAFVDYQMHVPANAILTLVTLAMLLAAINAPSSGCWKAMRGSRWVVTGFLVLVSFAIAYEAQKGWREQRLLSVASRQSGLEKIATLKRAFCLEPTNFETAYWIGEYYRAWSWQGDENFKELADEAMPWFAKASMLNPFDPFPPLRQGMCLDWLKRFNESEAYYRRATQLDPNNYLVAANYGWHYFQAGDYTNSFKWFERSWSLNPTDNEMATLYFQLLHERSSH